ncbi:MAG: hypothetical protein V4703_04175, partial [Actinomycetota bacterium]
ALAAEAMEIAAKQREQVAAPVLSAEPLPDVEARRIELNGHTYVLDKAPEAEDVSFRVTTEFERNVLAHAQPRIQLLLSKQDEGPLGTPSWRTKTMAALYFKIKSQEAIQSNKPDEARAFERAFQQDLYELLEASNQPFGDWRKSAAPKIVVASR